MALIRSNVVRLNRIVLLGLLAILGAAIACGSFASESVPNADSGLPEGSTSGPDATTDAPCTADLAKDPANCGRCRRSCLKGTCAEGRCSAFVLTEPANTDALWLALDDESVYWADEAGGKIGRCARGGCAEPTILTMVPKPVGIEVSGTDLFFGSYAIDGGAGAIWKCAKNDCANPTSFKGGESPIQRLAVDDNWLAWPQPQVVRLTRRDGSGAVFPAATTPGNYSKLTFSGGDLYFSSTTGGLPLARCTPPCDATQGQVVVSTGIFDAIAASGSRIVVADRLNSTLAYILSTDSMPAVPKPITASLGTVTGLVVVGSAVYWIAQSAGSEDSAVYGCLDMDACTSPTIFASGYPRARELRGDARGLYWTVKGGSVFGLAL